MHHSLRLLSEYLTPYARYLVTRNQHTDDVSATFISYDWIFGAEIGSWLKDNNILYDVEYTTKGFLLRFDREEEMLLFKIKWY